MGVALLLLHVIHDYGDRVLNDLHDRVPNGLHDRDLSDLHDRDPSDLHGRDLRDRDYHSLHHYDSLVNFHPRFQLPLDDHVLTKNFGVW